jgi:hypothetical protein
MSDLIIDVVIISSTCRCNDSTLPVVTLPENNPSIASTLLLTFIFSVVNFKAASSHVSSMPVCVIA